MKGRVTKDTVVNYYAANRFKIHRSYVCNLKTKIVCTPTQIIYIDICIKVIVNLYLKFIYLCATRMSDLSEQWLI